MNISSNTQTRDDCRSLSQKNAKILGRFVAHIISAGDSISLICRLASCLFQEATGSGCTRTRHCNFVRSTRRCMACMHPAIHRTRQIPKLWRKLERQILARYSRSPDASSARLRGKHDRKRGITQLSRHGEPTLYKSFTDGQDHV